MTQPRVVANVTVQDLSGLEAVDRYFEAGEYGEVRLPLDRDIATETQRNGTYQAVYALEAELKRDGMKPWPGERLVRLQWSARTISIRFVAQSRASPLGPPGAFVVAAALIAPAVIRGAVFLKNSSTVARLLARVPGLSRLPSYINRMPGASKVFNIVRKAAKFPVVRRILNITELVGAGAAVWVMLDENQRIAVLKWPGKMLAKGAGKAGEALLDQFREFVEKAGKPMIIGIGVVAVGVAIVLLMPKKG